MSSIHVLYDPKDQVTGLPGPQMRSMGVSAVIFRGEISKDRVDAIAHSLAALLLREIAKDNPNASQGT